MLELKKVSPVTDKIQPWVFPNVAGTGPVNLKSFGKHLADRQRPPGPCTAAAARWRKPHRSVWLAPRFAESTPGDRQVHERSL